MQVNIHEAKTHLSKLLQRVAQGEEVTIARAGVPVAKLIAVTSAKRPLGIDKGKIWISDDFDAPIPEFEAMFTDAPLMTEQKPKVRKRKR